MSFEPLGVPPKRNHSRIQTWPNVTHQWRKLMVGGRDAGELRMATAKFNELIEVAA